MMRNTPAPLRINFAPRSFLGGMLSTPRWIIVVGILGLALLTSAGIQINDLAAEKARLQSASERYTANAARDSGKNVMQETPIPEAKALAINHAVDQLNLPWSDLFDAVEEATPANIALVSIEPDSKRHILKGEAEAINSDDMIAYIELLKKVPLFVEANLTKHTIDQQDPYKPYRFSFEAEWREGGS